MSTSKPEHGIGNRTTALAPGAQAPDFSLHTTPDQRVSLSELRGNPVILAFYPADWSPVCGDQMSLYNEILPEFRRFNATLVGISVDGSWCHSAFASERKLQFPLLADFEPKGAVARSYGVYRERTAFASARCLCWTQTERFDGATSPQWASIPARTAFSRRSKHCLSRRSEDGVRTSSHLTQPVSQRDHISGPASATSHCWSTATMSARIAERRIRL